MNTEDIIVIEKEQDNQSSPLALMQFFNYWRKLGFFSPLHWKVFFYWISILFFIGFMPIYIISHPRKLDNFFINISSNYYPVMVIICLSFIVIAVGTFIYAFDVYKQTFNANNNIKSLAPLYFISLLLCYASVAFCIVGIYNINDAVNIHAIVEAAENYSKYIFFTLLIIDILMLIAKNIEINYHKKNNLDNISTLENESKFVFNQMIFIDLPVLIGVLFISLFIHSADSTGYYSTQISKLDKVDIFQFFKTFFAVGSIGMHIIFSQLIFVILNTKNIHHKIITK